MYYLSVKGSVKLVVNFSVMFHNTNGNNFCSETGSSTASLLCGSTVGYPSDSLASCSLSDWSLENMLLSFSTFAVSDINCSVDDVTQPIE